MVAFCWVVFFGVLFGKIDARQQERRYQSRCVRDKDCPPGQICDFNEPFSAEALSKNLLVGLVQSVISVLGRPNSPGVCVDQEHVLQSASELVVLAPQTVVETNIPRIRCLNYTAVLPVGSAILVPIEPEHNSIYKPLFSPTTLKIVTREQKSNRLINGVFRFSCDAVGDFDLQFAVSIVRPTGDVVGVSTVCPAKVMCSHSEAAVENSAAPFGGTQSSRDSSTTSFSVTPVDQCRGASCLRGDLVSKDSEIVMHKTASLDVLERNQALQADTCADSRGLVPESNSIGDAHIWKVVGIPLENNAFTIKLVSFNDFARRSQTENGAPSPPEARIKKAIKHYSISHRNITEGSTLFFQCPAHGGSFDHLLGIVAIDTLTSHFDMALCPITLRCEVINPHIASTAAAPPISNQTRKQATTKFDELIKYGSPAPLPSFRADLGPQRSFCGKRMLVSLPVGGYSTIELRATDFPELAAVASAADLTVVFSAIETNDWAPVLRIPVYCETAVAQSNLQFKYRIQSHGGIYKEEVCQSVSVRKYNEDSCTHACVGATVDGSTAIFCFNADCV